MRNDSTFRVYSLVSDPGGRTGTVGANGEDFQVVLGAGTGGDTFVGRLSGDYMYVAPAEQRPVAEPGALGLMVLGLPVLLRRRRRGLKMLVGVVLAGLLFTSVASAGIISGVCTNGSYGDLNAVYQWEIGSTAAECRYLGKVDLDPMFGGSASAADIATLSDRRLAVTHKDATGANVVSVFTPQYDGGGNLTGLTLDATMPSRRGAVNPLPNGNFVEVSGDYDRHYVQTGPNVWTMTERNVEKNRQTGLNAGLVNPNNDEWVVGRYSRHAQKNDITHMVADCYNQDPTNSNTYVQPYDGKTYYYRFYGDSPAEGSCSSLLANGWVHTGGNDWGNHYEATVNDSTATSGSHDSVVGFLRNADGSGIERKQIVSLDDGRVVLLWSSGYMKSTVTWNIYSLVNNPANQPAGSIGASGEDFQAVTANNFVGQISGDYMYEPPPPPVAEPGVLSLAGIGLLALRRRRR